MDLFHCVEESQILQNIELFNLPLQAGKVEFQRQLLTNWSSNITNLSQRANDILNLRNYPELLEKSKNILNSLKESEKTISEYVVNETSKTAEGQIYFQGEHTKVLNHIPFLISIFVILKIWVAPILALFTPLLLLILPYIIMISVMDIPIPWDVYMGLAKQMVFGIQTTEPWKPKHYLQALWTCGSVIQGIFNPFMTAYHTYNLDKTILKRGEAIKNLVNSTTEILDNYKSKGILQDFVFQIPEMPSNPREIVAWYDSEPIAVKILQRILGTLSVITTIASDSRWKPVDWSTNKTISLNLSSSFDLAISDEKAIKSNISLKHHALLTGPNRGGKSSALRSILQQVLLGQTFGMTFGTEGSWTPFKLLFTRLKSRDHAGRESLFEMEVRMASTIYKTLKRTNHHSLVLIDELFHSTNPPDAETSAKYFLNLLWKMPSVKSIISTHIFSLCNGTYKPQLLCCPAEELPDGRIEYSYKVQEGTCFVSSVREVLAENGLGCA